ncbi:hypothetical protein V8F33_013449 [Rhypophila sp. PSN 637]
MNFSSKDYEDIQRVAGLLNLTVDELLQQRRRPSQLNSPGALDRNFGSLDVGSSSPYTAPSAYDDDQQSPPVAWPLNSPSTVQSGSGDPDHFDVIKPQTRTAGIEEGSALVHSTSRDQGNEKVILLNPHTTWYDCDASLWDFNESTRDTVPVADQGSEVDDGDSSSFVPVVPMQIDSELGSVTTARDDSGGDKDMDDISTDWAIVPSSPGSSSPFQTPASPSNGSLDRRYHLIAPKNNKPSSYAHSISESSSHKVRKKRSPYQGTKKADTHLTRQVHACVRCRMQRNRCIPDPSNPRGPCVTCQLKTVRMSRLPCLRYMVTDSTLFRTGLDYMPFYKAHPMAGPEYGDFHLDRFWTGSPPKTLCLGQLGAMSFKVELQEFVPPVSSEVDLKGRPMYAVPWAIADPDAVVESINNYIDRGVTAYLYGHLDDTDPLVWDIFQAAYRASVFPTPNRMLQKTLRLWVACRFIESKWRCWGDDGWADDSIRASNPRDPFYDWDSLPPYLDYQIASIIIHRILTPLRKDVLRDLQSTLNTHSPKDWFVTFLTSFILLQNYEMQMRFQREFAARRKAQVQYLDMPLVRATNSGAKTILAHFHYCYKGQQLFKEGFDWTAPRVKRMARLDAEQINFMAQCRDNVVRKASMFESINRTNSYHQLYWYTSQLFDSDWVPRDTLEHAPPAEEKWA